MHTLPEGHPGLEGNPNRPPPAPAEQLEQRVEQQQQATEEQDVLDDEFLAWAREQGVAVGSGPEEEGGDVAPTPPPVKQAFASSGAGGTVTPQAAVTTIDQVDIVGDPNEIDEVNVVGDSNAPEPQAGGSFSYGDTGSTLGFGGGGRDSAYAASQQLAKDTPKIYPDTALGKVMESGDKRRAREKLRRKRRGAWQAYANDPDRVSGIVDQSLMEEDWMESDERAKGGIKQGTASAMFEETPGYSYHYKEQFQDDPGAAPGEHFGIMAQDLEKTPEGASMVQEDERGLKHVDTERLTMANSAALNEILARLNKMEGRND